jgi:ribose transport system substrate-binding protein
VLGLLICGAAALGAGCGSSSEEKTSVAGAKASGSSAVAGLKTLIEERKQTPKFAAPGPAFDASKAKGKTIFNIPLNSSLPFDSLISAASKQAAEAAGVNFINYTNQGKPSEWVQGINDAIGRKADIIILEGSPDPQLLRPQIAAAKKAGIPVISTHLYDKSYAATALQEIPDLAGIVPANHYEGGKLMADFAIADSNAKVNAFFVTANEVQPSAGIVKAFEGELATHCPDTCKATVVNIPITDWAQKITTAVQSALVKDPTINYVVPVYDGATQFLASGVLQASATDRIKIVAYNGTASVLKMLQDKKMVVAEIGEPVEWLGWANTDQALRILAGEQPITDGKTPLRVFDSSNVDETGTPPVQTQGYGDPSEYINGYRKLWGLDG